MVRLILTIVLSGPLPVQVAGPAGCPATPDADQVAKGQVAADNDWWYHWLDPKRLWPLTTGRGVRVAIVDTGANSHRQLTLGKGADFVRGSGDGKLDCTGRGTALASLIAARPARGLAGLAPAAEVVPVRVSEGATTMSPHDRDLPHARLASAIRWAADNAVPVITVPFATTASGPLQDAVAHAIAKGAVVIAPVGADNLTYPAAYPGVIGVGAIDEAGNRSKAVAKHVDLYAPGLNVIVAARDTDHFLWAGGADAASAIVGAAAALVKSAHPQATGEQVANRLLLTATGGLLDPYRAVTEIIEPSRSRAAELAIAKAEAAESNLADRALRFAGVLFAATILLAFFTGLVRRRRGEGSRPALRPPHL